MKTFFLVVTFIALGSVSFFGMLGGNNTELQNGTTIIDTKPEVVGFSFFRFLFLPVCIVSSIILLSTAVYYIRRKKRLDQLRDRLLPVYHFDPGEYDAWEEELMENSKPKMTTHNAQYYSMSSSRGNFQREKDLCSSSI